MDQSFAGVSKSAAIFIGKGYRDTAGFKVDFFAITTNEMALSCYFADSSLAILQGEYQQYYAVNKLQSEGTYQNNQKQGVWQDWDMDGQKTDSDFYDNGLRMRYTHYRFFNDKKTGHTWLSEYEMKDTLTNTFDKYYFSDSGKLMGKVHFAGNNGIHEQYKEGKTNFDTVFSREEKEAMFPGGTKGWTKYVQKALGSFNPGEHGAGNGKWQVIVKFIVDTDGSISDVTAETNFGYKMEQTVVKMIAMGPKWVPANKFGKPVKAYRRQPVTFMVDGL